MHRNIALAAFVVSLAAPPAAGAEAPPPPVEARLAACRTGPEAADRSATFTAGMRAVAGTRRMWMRFQLLQRTPPGTAFLPVRVDTWGRWQRSEPGRPGFIYTKRVEGLLAPAAYRAVVRFRWYGRGGRLLRSARRVTRACRQPDPRPNLRAGRLIAEAAPEPGAAIYRLVVANDGRGPAGPFDVVLTANELPQPPARLGGPAPGGAEVAAIVGPRCAAGSTVRIELDAASEVDEADEHDNVVDRPCPFAVG